MVGGLGLATVGLAALNAGGGVGVLSGTVVVGVAGTALAWTGIGLFVVGIAAALYCGYRLFTQRNQEDTPWTKPTDMPSNSWQTRFVNQAGLFPPIYPAEPVPEVWSSICYTPPNCP